MKENKPKVKKMKSGSKITAHSIMFMMLSLVLTFALFLGLIFVQNYLSEEITYQQVLVAKNEIPAGVILTTDNAADYLGFKQMNVLDITPEYLQTADALLGMKSKVHLVKGEPVMVKDFEDVISYVEQFENPVEMSIAAPDAANADGGKLRAGDMINITLRYSNSQLVGDYYTGVENTNETSNGSSYSWFEPYELEEMNQQAEAMEENADNSVTDEIPENETNTEEVENNITELPEFEIVSQTNVIPAGKNSTMKASSKAYNFENQYAYLLEGVYIHKVLDANGNEIAPEDTTSVASILVLIIDRSAEIELNEMLENGASMRISKIVNKEKYMATILGEKEEAAAAEENNDVVTNSDSTESEIPTDVLPENLTEGEVEGATENTTNTEE